MGITDIMELIKKGKFETALKDLSNNNSSIDKELLVSLILTYKGQVKKSLQIANNILEKNISIGNPFFEFKALILKSINFLYENRWRESYNEILKAEELIDDINDLTDFNNQIWIAEFKCWKGILIEILFGDIQLSMDLFKQAIEIYMENEDYRGICTALILCSEVQSFEGLQEESKEYAEQSLNLSKKYDLLYPKSYSCRKLGQYYISTGKLDLALYWLKKAVEIAKSINYYRGERFGHLFLGLAYLHNGKYNHSLKELEQSIKQAEEFEDHHLIASGTLIIAEIMHIRGDVDNAIKKIFYAFNIFKRLKDHNCCIDCNLKLGKAYMTLGNFSLAFEEFKNSFKHRLWNQENNQPTIDLPLHLYAYPETLYQLALVSLELNLINEAWNYQKRLEQYHTKKPSPLISYQTRLTKALILKHSKRIKEKVKSQILLEELITENIEDQGLIVYTILSYCEALVAELKQYGEIEVFNEIENLISKLLLMAKEQNSILLQIETLLLKANIALIHGNATETSQILDSALKIAENHNLLNLINRINYQEKKISDELSKWNELADRNASFQERLELIDMKHYIQEAQKFTKSIRKDTFTH